MELLHARSSVVIAAKAYGLSAIDMVSSESRFYVPILAETDRIMLSLTTLPGLRGLQGHGYLAGRVRRGTKTGFHGKGSFTSLHQTVGGLEKLIFGAPASDPS
jgi:hypothetical protein